MALFKIDNVKIAGISACVPADINDNRVDSKLSESAVEEFISTTGVAERRIAQNEVCTSDLVVASAEKLIGELGWEKNDIDIIVFVSQTPDFTLPTSAPIIQDRLGLSRSCIALDIPLGCSGYVYGLSVVGSMISGGKLKKGLLLVGDTISKIVSADDKSTQPLFGDAGSATALEYNAEANPMLFDLGSDGSGHQAIIVPDGGSRRRTTEESFKTITYGEGIARNQLQLSLDGMDVFAFGITQVPKTVNALIDNFAINKEDVDYFVFHQANLKMNKMIAKKLKLPDEKVPYSLEHFGNTSSATIPLTIVTSLKDKLNIKPYNKFIFCGFGVGLSWGTVYVETTDLVCCDLIEYDA